MDVGDYLERLGGAAERAGFVGESLVETEAGPVIETGRVIDDHEVREPGWIHHAAEADLPTHWPEAIFLAKLGCPLSFTFEAPSGLELGARVAALVAAVRAVMAEG